ncbi:pteridine reductase [Legionella antarctica]|uniref:Pteridine reductase n=1 Tax=Legionella antarctica TaxID=2708020 RepID=A0A6F8T8L8_9GAMM|nr:pteridine reductase [Legionella antarctica]BCA97025.1 pteridine reductase [Legionella antarctica]
MNQANKQEAKVALVTGGARRIGAAIVKKLHESGYKVVIHCRRTLDDAHALAVQLNNLRVDSAFILPGELTEHEASQVMMTTIIDWAGRLDLLVNNAAVFMRTEDHSLNPKDWQTLFDTNVKAPYLLSLAAYPFLKAQQGAIVNITDIHAEKPLKGYSVYCQSKAALKMQTETLAREFAPEVRVNAVAPGATIWPEDANALNEAEKEKIIANTPLKTHGKPEYIAQAILALAQNPFITGQTLKVDGGRSLMG